MTPDGRRLSKAPSIVQEHPDGDPLTEDSALEVVHSVTEGGVCRPAFAEGMLVAVEGGGLKDRLLQVPEDETFERLENEGNERNGAP